MFILSGDGIVEVRNPSLVFFGLRLGNILKIHLSGIVVIVGNYGSGKTEIAVNLALYMKREGHRVQIADLDLVNPYFRTREAREPLSRLGIEMVLPPQQYLQADLPIVSPAIAGMIKASDHIAILDVGGNDVGATVLASLADALGNRDIRMLQVINPFRPFTQDYKGCLKIKKEIEDAAKMEINGIVGNANMIDDTRLEDIVGGYQFVKGLSKETGLPLEFITAERELLNHDTIPNLGCPVLPIERQLVPPWKKAATLSI